MLYSIAIASLSLNAAYASSLNTLRLGVTPQKTRLVFELDRTTPYQVDFDDSTARVSFDALTVTPEVVNTFRNGLGGLLDQIDYKTVDGKTTFTLSIKDHFHLRYFDLVAPTRVVVDFYPREEEPELASTTLAPAVAPPAPLEESTKQEISTQEPTQPIASATEETIGMPDSTNLANVPDDLASEQAMSGTDAGSAAEEPTQRLVNTAKLNENRGRSRILLIGALGIVGLLAVSALILRRKPTKKEKIQPRFDTKFDTKTETPAVPEMQIEFVETETVAQVQTHSHSANEGEVAGERPQEWTEETAQQIESPSDESKISDLDLRNVKAELFIKPDDTTEWKEPDPISALEPPPIESAVEGKFEAEIKNSQSQDEIQPQIPLTEEKSDPSFRLDELTLPEEMGIEEKPEIAEEQMSEVPISQQRVNLENAIPELRIEDGTLIWPVHLLDGGRDGRILVVDDEADIVKPIEEYLTSQGFEVLGLTNSAAALEKYADWHPDLIILDVAMPKLSGVDFVKEIRKEEKHRKVIFLSGKTERDTVEAAFAPELQIGLYEFFKKPVLLEQIGGRVKDYFLAAQEVLQLNLTDQLSFSETIEHLSPHQLVALHSFLWDRIFEVSAEFLGRRIEPFFITDRMEPATEYMRRMGCQERRDYCIARVCIVSNPLCASNRLRAELEIMRQILQEFREEYLARIHRGVTTEEPEIPAPRKKRAPKRTRKKELVESEAAVEAPPRKTVKKNVAARKR